jgi:RNA polymerase sigma-70 factor (ECF subfamily)
MVFFAVSAYAVLELLDNLIKKFVTFHHQTPTLIMTPLQSIDHQEHRMHISEQISFNKLVQCYREPLTRAAYHLCGDREAACDLVQETFIDAYKGYCHLRESEKAGTWLYTILRRKAIVYRQKRKPYINLDEEQISYPHDEAESLVRGIVVEQMEKLADEDREILAGKYLLGLSYQELADSLGVKEGTVRVRCLRAKERLREILRGSGIQVPEKR